MVQQKPRHFINLSDLDENTIRGIIGYAQELKSKKFNPPQIFDGLSLAMLFDKRSTRTRMSFEVAMKQLGGHTIVMNNEESQIGGAESIESTAKVMSRYVDAIMVRMSHHGTVIELSEHSEIPIINAMTDQSHPCQIMADVLTIEEQIGPIEGKKIAWFGDINNVSNTFVEAANIFGFDLHMAVPEDLHAQAPEGVHVTADPKEAADKADVLITDTWESMGQEGKSLDKFKPFQVTQDLMGIAHTHAIFMHCMPIHEWEEVTEDVARGPQSRIYEEAENRLHVQKAILAWCLQDSGVALPKQTYDF